MHQPPMVSGAEPPVDRAARERRFQKPCVGAEPVHRHSPDAIGYRRHRGRRSPCRSVPVRRCPRPPPGRPWRRVPSPPPGGRGRRRDRRSPPAGRRPHRRCTAGSACRCGQALLDANLVLPLAEHVVDVPKPGVPAKPEVRQRHVGRRFTAQVTVRRIAAPRTANSNRWMPSQPIAS